ncbi:uncharacterized protein LOC133806847 [Humulus lupulus]|uniref:uncharacterized protein LOC133806847 n=1 Tax=Humulus lupulus TaxID=3486 RepID=UPI002B412FE9|nr:uncharacterized protein LOC133806847 [Humulus lupulus]
MGSIRTFELNQQIKQKGKLNHSIEKSKGIAFKVSEKDVSDDEKDDEIALLTRNFQKFMKKIGIKRIFQKLQKKEEIFLCLNNTLTDVDKKEIDLNSDKSELNEESLAESYKVLYGKWLQVYTENRSFVKMNKELSHNIKDFEEKNKCCEFELCSKNSELLFLTKELDKLKRNVKMLNPSSNIFEEGSVFTAEHAVSTEMKQSAAASQMWYFDSGCSRHMTGDRDFLVNIRPIQCGEVTFGNGLAGNVIGMGTLNFEGLPRLKNVILVEGLRTNLLSVSKICDKGYTVNFDSNRCSVVNDQDFFREESYTFYAFKSLCLKLCVEKYCNIGKIVRIRSDHGKEFENTVYDEFCKSKGISHEFSAPKTPQQNGVVERKN